MSATAEKRPLEQTTPAGARLEITVVFTNTEATVAALRYAGELADRLNGRITIVVPQVVSYQLPIHQPPVRDDWNRRRFSQLALESPVETAVHFYLCRDSWVALTKVLKPHSLIVLSGAAHWWNRESRLAGRLRCLGHEVILTGKE